MKLDNKTLKKYRGIGHQLNPVVIVANGLSENVQAEINRALSDHELIKIRIITDDRKTKKIVIAEICEQQKAFLVQIIGKTPLIYRAAIEQKTHLSNICRYQEK